ncbi:DNA repair and recombination protein RAD54B-like [Physella acuta]|uniref:DNA repair and recombination protein RAD54B-like n=1 Tax=Physella acuta TaxID=109671 RepID=UPI0027DB065B|nr:DNA repair and recombination protein RAD54B-like [Physella acuta]XP_059139438.1 DNA repair and recombination protein RAD54B-like [Physella acuta]XP_059139439.1 DNA repair and recombination protein RAD54B-like [Physella acuta]
MRRSAAPSQTAAGNPLKRTKFSAPLLPALKSDHGSIIPSSQNIQNLNMLDTHSKTCDVQYISPTKHNETFVPPTGNSLGYRSIDIISNSVTTSIHKNTSTNWQPKVSNSLKDGNVDRHEQQPFSTIRPVATHHTIHSNLKENMKLTPAKHKTTDQSAAVSQLATTGASYFSVVWCKLSKKKHKTWEGDAILVTSGKSVTLYDTEGKVIAKGSGYKAAVLDALEPDGTLVVGGKEVQILSVLAEDKFKSGQCFLSTQAEQTCDVSTKSTKLGASKPFISPLMHSNNSSLKAQAESVETLKVCPRHEPTTPGALVMPRPSPEHQWKHNKQGLPIVDVVVDPYLSSYLRQHQREGVLFLYECIMGMRNYEGLGAILADDMGLGKTLQCIALIWTLLKQGPYGGKPVLKKVLIVTPGSLVKNWYEEFKKWLGTERLNVYAVSTDHRADDFVKSRIHPVLVISYEMLVRSYQLIEELAFDLVICDEGHRLKNTATRTTALMMNLACQRRVVLTGTPVQNDLQEFYTLVNFCNPGVLGTSASFSRVYEDTILASRQPNATPEQEELGAERSQELARLTQMFLLRRTQEMNQDFLPPKVELVLFCRPSPLQLLLYKHLIQSKVVSQLMSSRQVAGSPHLVCIGALKQLCNHPALIFNKISQPSDQQNSLYDGVSAYLPENFEVSVEDSGKLHVLSALLSSIWHDTAQEKVVLASSHTKTLDLLQEFFRTSGYSFVRLDGQTPTNQRQDLVNKFNNQYSNHRIFLLSTKAGGVGLNLIGASRLILYDIDWNPANDLQAMARVWRDGQKRRVHIYRLLTTGTIEEKIYQRQITKQGLSGAVMDNEKMTSVQFSPEDLKDLFSLDETTECYTHSKLGCLCHGDPTHVKEIQLEKSAEERQCQLGQTNKQNQTSNLSMAELYHWNHWKGHLATDIKNWCLSQVDETLSFVLWQEASAK